MITGKDTPIVEDRLVIEGGEATKERLGGIQSLDGAPLDPELIARNFGVPLEEAERIIRRLSR
jgi:hypothetical protein